VSASRSVIVTGAGSGIGAAVAKAFVDLGDRVYLADLSPERLAESVEAIGSDLAVARTLDVTDYEAFCALVADVVTETGHVDVIVNNAGVWDGAAPVQDTTPELWNRVIGINLTGCYHGAKAVTDQMIAQGSGRIINISSIGATRAMPNGLAYDASKAGIEGMTRRLAFDLAPFGITANAIAPGAIATNVRSTSAEILGDLIRTDRSFSARPDLLDIFIPAKRRGDAAELAAAVVFLASDGAAYVNGDVLRVDGGWAAV